MTSEHIKIIATNKKARHDYHLSDEVEAGIVLTGTEVKSIRDGRVTIKDAYAEIKNGEVFLRQLHINPYAFAYYDNHDPLRSRKLLLHNYEIKRMIIKTKERGYTIIPLKLYFKNGKVKVQIALAKGKKLYDKRESIKEREVNRELDRVKKKYQD
ncbi:SmpB [Desulforapulum autotrophicum HRM2]|jgi:SsrA-binding protein|uniref:SsrA-binding protein n=1 Tax=Desulforapulum autotrophicum (strain ATCC 43914 / DSM 3382 / VKM B-1955 / HRM2) TaxID=177437 RepID=C0QBZ3_DESAH|nr:SsrA-binding protein SmpB [Desulforapulum autotrophicum]ACN15005.1 SmpB [Desulforapulum autotrophicum HRM2]